MRCETNLRFVNTLSILCRCLPLLSEGLEHDQRTVPFYDTILQETRVEEVPLLVPHELIGALCQHGWAPFSKTLFQGCE